MDEFNKDDVADKLAQKMQCIFSSVELLYARVDEEDSESKELYDIFRNSMKQTVDILNEMRGIPKTI